MPRPDALPSLVADVGGTNTRVALARDGVVDPASVRKLSNRDHDGLAPLLRRYLAEAGDPACAAACVAVAGPVRDGVGRLTNLDWQIDLATLAAATGASTVDIVNDLQAQGHALGHLTPGALTELVAGPAAPEGATRLVVGVGTGFNATPVHGVGRQRLVAPSEAGHLTLPVRSAEELRLAERLSALHGFAGIEEVLSGRGLANLDAFFAAEMGGLPGRDPAGVMAALAEEEPRARTVARLWVKLLGRVMGDLALTHLPFGGIYLIGGVARAVSPYFERYDLAAAFRDKGRFGPFMRDFRVQLVTDDFSALTGCANHLARLLRG